MSSPGIQRFELLIRRCELKINSHQFPFPSPPRDHPLFPLPIITKRGNDKRRERDFGITRQLSYPFRQVCRLERWKISGLDAKPIIGGSMDNEWGGGCGDRKPTRAFFRFDSVNNILDCFDFF